MLVSEYYHLNQKQPTLDFVDVNVKGDVRVFVDPRALRLLGSSWGHECVALVQSFFTRVLELMRAGQDEEAKRLLRALREPNETHLGLSRGRSRGRALGPGSATEVWEALRDSAAAKSGLLEDLEDTILMVEGISSDIVSDITTNIIRQPLISYTQDMCRRYDIPLTHDVSPGPLWDPNTHEWFTEYRDLPVVNNQRLLLVPKVIVRRRMDYDQEEYERHYILPHLQEQELSANSALVQLLKNGKARVTKKDVIAKYGRGKGLSVSETLRNPQLLEQYRADKRRSIQPPLSHIEFTESLGAPRPEWDQLLDEVVSVEPGRDQADAYHKATEKLLSAIFYPSLASPRLEFPIHAGRKRIDITYLNVAQQGFFAWLAQHYPAGHIFVECKNYRGDLSNPELDQISGRFSPSRGCFGLVVCRGFEDKATFIARCRDTALDQRGFVIVLDDADLRVLAQYRQLPESDNLAFDFLKARFDELIM